MSIKISAVLLLSLTTSILFSQIDKKSTAAANVSIIAKEFVIPKLNAISHKIWVYLPPDYLQSKKKYSVIYMHDGQNLFDDSTSYLGEWNVDETLNSIYQNTGKGFIVVGIENGRSERINEYTPWKNEQYGGGKGAIYMDFIVKTLKPYIDANYRTKKNSKNTALIGSSLGGLISFYGGLKFPDVFGRIGALSTSFWFSKKSFEFAKEHGNIKRLKLYLLTGEKEGESVVNDSKKIVDLLGKNGFKKRKIHLKINPEGAHNEVFWRGEFPAVISWLFNIKNIN